MENEVRGEGGKTMSATALRRVERAAAARQAELDEVRKREEFARERLIAAAIAFCDGSISPGQLRAVREFLREQSTRLAEIEGVAPGPFQKDSPSTAPLADPDVVGAGPLASPALGPMPPAKPSVPVSPEMAQSLTELDAKVARLEQDFQQGRINASQYRAIRKHYLEQRQVAMRMSEAHPGSDRWKVILQEGKTTFLLQLNEAVCRSVAFYDLKHRDRIFVQGEMPPAAEAAMALLGTFGQTKAEGGGDRMLATQTEDGSALLLIPGRYTAALVVFSQEPPGWQVRAMREIHRNFEVANKSSLDRGNRTSLVYPDLGRFIRP
jgi:hypothetical protein